MQQLTIKTNSQWRPIIYGYELTEKERKEFDWISDIDNASFFKYKGTVYSLDDFIVCESEEFKGWDGVYNETYFSGVAIKLSKGGEYVKAARYYIKG